MLTRIKLSYETFSPRLFARSKGWTRVTSHQRNSDHFSRLSFPSFSSGIRGKRVSPPLLLPCFLELLSKVPRCRSPSRVNALSMPSRVCFDRSRGKFVRTKNRIIQRVCVCIHIYVWDEEIVRLFSERIFFSDNSTIVWQLNKLIK